MRAGRKPLRRAVEAVGLAAALLTGVAVHAAVQQDHFVNGGGSSSGTASQITWSALGEPLGGRMSGGGFIVDGGGFPPPPGNSAPVITAFNPADKSRFYRQEPVSVSATATDANQDPLEFRFLLNGTVIQAWSGSSTLSGGWNTSGAAFGWHTLTVEVRDAEHTVSRQHRVFIFHRPPSP